MTDEWHDPEVDADHRIRWTPSDKVGPFCARATCGHPEWAHQTTGPSAGACHHCYVGLYRPGAVGCAWFIHAPVIDPERAEYHDIHEEHDERCPLCVAQREA
jgi:hypothetical protein